MKKVITYGSFDYLHFGHIRLLERAKSLGDYLIVGVTSEDYDRKRGKINVQQSLAQRIDNVRKTGLADEIIVEEYIGQKIDDIKRYDIDIFTIGSDWKGKFDYLKEYCEVVYLPRTKGISSTEIRCKNNDIKLGLIGDDLNYLKRYQNEDRFVNGINVVGVCSNNKEVSTIFSDLQIITDDIDELIKHVDAIYIDSSVNQHYIQIKKALENKKHVLCESPICLNKSEFKDLQDIAKKNNVILMDAIRVAYSTAYSRLLLLLKGGEIGNILSVDVTITSLNKFLKSGHAYSFMNWGAQALLPVLDILGNNYKDYRFYTKFIDRKKEEDIFTRLDLCYKNAVACVKVAEGAKSEGELIITGTLGYVIVPAPWWKLDYFEIRYENTNDNKRFFYQLDGEGIRYQLLSFIQTINGKKDYVAVSNVNSEAICEFMNRFVKKENMFYL